MDAAATSATYSLGFDEAIDESTGKSSTMNTVSKHHIYQSSDKGAQELYGHLVISRFALFLAMLLVCLGSLCIKSILSH